MANDISTTLENYFKQLPSSLQGNGQNFIYLLKNMLSDLTGELNDKFEEISKIANSITDAPDTITEQLKSCTVAEKRVGTNISLTLNWDYSDIKNYDSAEIFVKTSTDLATDWSTVDVSKTITTTKTGSYVLDGCNAGTVYHFTFLGKNTYGSVSVESSAPTLTYEVSAMNNTPDAPTEFEVYTSKTGLVWKWKQPVGIDYSVSELRLDTNVGSTTNLLEVTQDCTSDVQPTSREGTAYLYNKGYGSKYSDPVSTTWSKPVPTAPQNLKVTTTWQGLQITYGAIPDDCMGIAIYINNIRHDTTDASYNYYCSTGSYTVKACYYDSFGEGTMCSEVTVSTVEEIPPNAVHITDQTVFDDGVIVGKYIGDHEVVGTKIKDGTITTDNIAAGTITANNIGTNAITTDKISAGAVGATQIQSGAIEAEHIQANAIDATKIKAGAITSDKLNAETINMSGALKIVGGNVTLDQNGLTEKMLNGSTVTFGSKGMEYRDTKGQLFNIVGKQIIGVAQNGKYVRFSQPWDSTPSVMIIPQAMVINHPSYSQQQITLHSYADQLSQNGFYVRCYSGIQNASGCLANPAQVANMYWENSYDGQWDTKSGAINLAVPSLAQTLTVNVNITYILEYGGNFQVSDTPNLIITNGSNTIYNGGVIMNPDSSSKPDGWSGEIYDTRWDGGYQVYSGDNVETKQGGIGDVRFSQDITRTFTPNTTSPVYFYTSSAPKLYSGSIDKCKITVISTVTMFNYGISGETALDSNGSAIFIVSDATNMNYTVN